MPQDNQSSTQYVFEHPRLEMALEDIDVQRPPANLLVSGDTAYDQTALMGMMRYRRLRPKPPRGVTVVDGVLVWEKGEKVDQTDLEPTHWRIYADGDGDEYLVREVPVGQRRLQDNLVSSAVFVSAYSRPYRLESTRVPCDQALTGTATGGNTNTYHQTVLLSASTVISAISGAGAAAVGKWLVVIIRQPPTGTGPFTITWAAEFMTNSPTNLNMDPDAETVFVFAGQADGKWRCVMVPVWQEGV